MIKVVTLTLPGEFLSPLPAHFQFLAALLMRAVIEIPAFFPAGDVVHLNAAEALALKGLDDAAVFHIFVEHLVDLAANRFREFGDSAIAWVRHGAMSSLSGWWLRVGS